MAKFEENLMALEGVVERLERGDLSLEESVKLFEGGMKLSAACKAELEAAEGKIQILIDKGKSGSSTGEMDEAEFDVDDDDREDDDQEA